MTEPQEKRFYFPAWDRAWHANWVKDKGRVMRAPGVTCRIIQEVAGRPVDYLAKVETIAQQRALQAHRAVTADDLRHACHIIAYGRDLPHKDISNTQVERVVWLFNMLAEHKDIDAAQRYFNPSIAERDRFLRYLQQQCKPGFVLEIIKDRFGTSDLYSLSTENLHAVVRTMKHRPNGWRVPDPENCPF